MENEPGLPKQNELKQNALDSMGIFKKKNEAFHFSYLRHFL